MPAYNFKPEFADKIRYGTKRLTIRKKRKRGNPNPGDVLYLYTGMRTKSCTKLLEAKCTKVNNILISDDYDIYLDEIELNFFDAWKLALRDGFKVQEDFFLFFKNHYGLPFKGLLIKWNVPNLQFEYAEFWGEAEWDWGNEIYSGRVTNWSGDDIIFFGKTEKEVQKNFIKVVNEYLGI